MGTRPINQASEFATASASTAASSESIKAYFDTNVGQILQVVQTVDTTNRSTTSASYVTSNVAVTITPSSASSRIRIQVAGLGGNSSASTLNQFTLYRGATPLTPSGTTSMGANYILTDNVFFQMWSYDFIDSPSTTSATTYTLYWKTGGGTAYLGRRGYDTTIDNHTYITATEIRS